jgi:RHS repeat-associated protein
MAANGLQRCRTPKKTGGVTVYGYRHYTPKTGQFLGRDPIEESGGENLYAFVRNDGVNWLDILGLAQIITDMTDGFTYWIPSDCCCNEPRHWESNNVVLPISRIVNKETAESPYRSDDVYPVHGPYKGKPKAYGPNDLLKTDDARGRWLHGGGSGCAQPFAGQQGWYPTTGCTRLQNDDIKELVNIVRNHKKNASKGDQKITYYRSY